LLASLPCEIATVFGGLMRRPNYGQDAPGVVRGLAIGGMMLMVAALVVHGMRHKHGLHAGLFWQPGAALLATAAWMVWSSRIGKRRKVLALLCRRAWRGSEAVLDVGCGRGLATIAAAQRVPSGCVVGIDLWRGHDLSGNTPDAARANAEAAGVADRVTFRTGSATNLPFADSTFDVVVSMTVLHNIRSAAERRRAVEEMLRVLRPGGTLLIFDILHTPRYVKAARSAGAARTWLSKPSLLWALPGWSMVAEKAASRDEARPG
jgi:arsenite methyltransferase